MLRKYLSSKYPLLEIYTIFEISTFRNIHYIRNIHFSKYTLSSKYPLFEIYAIFGISTFYLLIRDNFDNEVHTYEELLSICDQ